MSQSLRQVLKKLVPQALRTTARHLHGSLSELGIRFLSGKIRLSENEFGLMLIDGEQEIGPLPQSLKSSLQEFTATASSSREISAWVKYVLDVKEGVVFDVGAHVGTMAFIAASVNRLTKIVCFEPSPLLALKLQDVVNASSLQNQIYLRQQALGAKSEKLKMAFDPVGGFVQADTYPHTMWGAPEALEVSVTTIDDVVAESNEIPQLIKIDVEGFEWEVLQGARKTLETSRPLLFVELHLTYLEYRGINPKKVTDFLTACGYGFVSLSGRFISSRRLLATLASKIYFVAKPLDKMSTSIFQKS